MSCPSVFNNPCQPPVNTAACETLPSQIQNFTLQFFGEVTKTEVDGAVTWVLPCSLETGLENNPRAAGEGLACYLLRLLDQGVLGYTGPAGADGAAGTNGYNGFTITTGPFSAPVVGSPVSIPMAYNPAIVVGGMVFIATSGWYSVNVVDWTSGFVNATLVQTFTGASAVVLAGRTVQPTGPQGVAGLAGATGPQGPAGAQGPAGQSPTSTHRFGQGSGSDYSVQATYQTVVFGTAQAAVQLDSVVNSVYLITAILAVETDPGETPEAWYDVSAQLVKVSGITTTAIAGTEQKITLNAPNDVGQVVINFRYTQGVSDELIRIQAKCDVAGKALAVAARTTISAVRLS